ncbi:MAG: hypothetical protein IJZ61_05675 [Oscillospiraceae bacterium]|nr:hypothetical protein [Oscillospiraceae bacterium]
MSIYTQIGNDVTVITNLTRYAIIAKIFGIELKLDDVKVLTDKMRTDIRIDEFNEGINRLVVLYGAGFINEDTFCVMAKNAMLHIDDLTAAENLVISQAKNEPEDRITPELLTNALRSAAYSKKYQEFENISFDEALQMTELAHVEIVDGCMRARDKEFLEFLMNIGEPMGNINDDQCSVEKEEKTNIEQLILDENSTTDEFPVIFDMKSAAIYSKLFDKAYGRDFILYARKKKMKLDFNCNDEYEKFVRMVKLHFEIRHYERIRQICGRKVNWFDYAPSVDGNISDNLSSLTEMKPVDLDVDEEYADDELLEKAVAKYARNLPFSEDTVFEVFHNGKVIVGVLRNKKFAEIDSKAFHSQLFDFNKIWGIIQMCSRDGQLKKQGECIVIPESVWKEIAPEQREYADRLIKEQYHRLVEHRKANKLLQSLSDLKASAESAKKIKEAGDAEKKAAEQKHIQDKENRPAGVET